MTERGEEYPSERELMEAVNATIFRDRPDLQYKFDGSAPPLLRTPDIGGSNDREG